MPPHLRLLLTLLAGFVPAALFAAEGCGHSVESVPQSVKQILDPHYRGDAAAGDLARAQRALELLMLEVAHCKLATQSISGRDAATDRELSEWHALDQWLYRLSNFVGQAVKGKPVVDWREELESFAATYGVEP